jgi:ring-1,2-phenylacetyl-CoA epoxidase subunit PaaD
VVAVDAAAVWRALEEVKDPEIPAVSVVELGLIRAVRVTAGGLSVDFAPTFAGCPALVVMRRDIEDRLRALEAGPVEVRLVLHPPWTTDWITDTGRAKLKAFGLAPPVRHGGRLQILLTEAADCPYCGSSRTPHNTSFGPTLCRAIYYCDNCQQPFEQFKGL